MWILEILGIVMAGGRGERVYPLTKDRVKAAVQSPAPKSSNRVGCQEG